MPDKLNGASHGTAVAPRAAGFTRSSTHKDRIHPPRVDGSIHSPAQAAARSTAWRAAIGDASSFLMQYRDACAETDRLFAAVHPDFLTSRPVLERHRLLFYIGHLEAFDWNLLASRVLRQPSFHPVFDHLFAFGIDPVGGGLPTDVPEDWPALDEIRRYRDMVRDRIETAIAHVDFSSPIQQVPADSPGNRPSASTMPAGVPLMRAESPISGGGNIHSDAGDGIVSVGTLCLVALEHRQMHAETLAYLIHQMPYERKRMPPDAAPMVVASGRARPRAADPDAPMCVIPSGTVTVGLPGRFASRSPHRSPEVDTDRHSTSNHASPDVEAAVTRRDDEHDDPSRTPRFGWDNEWVDPAAAQVPVPSFEIDRWMVTNGAFLRFVEAGGYYERSWWRDEDWAWRQTAGIVHPAFWEADAHAADGWRWRGMFASCALPLDWPVYVSRAEAAAYARFAGKRLPTEAEWLRAAEGVPGLPDMESRPPGEEGDKVRDRLSPAGPAEWASKPTSGFTGNADFRRWDPEPVDAAPLNRSRFGVEGQFGNGWEWIADPFAPFPGFTAFPFYRGYSADFFDDKHFVLKGGSPRTAARMLRPSFRNWFQAHYPYVYAGFRCVR
ncbi:formylglycine-generating enzyme required for sulfatase activity [Robbsia andropogonis]|uniref:SUMF1/EgtB/PvdO family nonheme iron enzyme n=1 Tax=Robbsia andropogonis TaxID=28092 RepID=UPI003D221B11